MQTYGGACRHQCTRLGRAYPHLLPQYERFYRGAYAPHHYTEEVHAAVQQFRERWEMTDRREARRRDPVGQLQMAL